MKRTLLPIFSTIGLLIVLVSFLLTGCSGGTTSPAPTTAAPPPPVSSAAPPPATSAAPATTVAPAPSLAQAQVKQTILKFADWNPAQAGVGKIHQQWADMIEKNSNGQLKVQIYFTESLLKQAEVLKGTQSGIADISYYTTGTDKFLQPLSLVTRLPFLGMPSTIAATAVWEGLYNKFPEIQKEWNNLKIVSIASMPADHLNFTKKAVHVPADIKGMKIIGRGEWPAALQNMGAAGLELSIGDWYTALDRGLAEGEITHFPVMVSVKILELLKNHTIAGQGGVSMAMSMFIMNVDTWNKLSPDLQKVIMDAGGWQRDAILKSDMADETTAIQTAKNANHTFVNLTADETKQWVDACSPVYQKWIDDNKNNGPSKAIVDETLNLIKKYPK
jgi:TRAP-type transport system periplasmic protein